MDKLGTSFFTRFTPSESLLYSAVVNTPISKPTIGDPIIVSKCSISTPLLSESSVALL